MTWVSRFSEFCFLLTHIAYFSSENYQEILVKLADFILEKEYDEAEHPIENPTFHYVFKKILDDDKKFTENGLKSKDRYCQFVFYL